MHIGDSKGSNNTKTERLYESAALKDLTKFCAPHPPQQPSIATQDNLRQALSLPQPSV